MTPGSKASRRHRGIRKSGKRAAPGGRRAQELGLAHRFAGSGDRAAIAGLVYDALRRRASSAFLMGADTPRAILLGMLKRERGLDSDAIAKSGERREIRRRGLSRR